MQKAPLVKAMQTFLFSLALSALSSLIVTVPLRRLMLSFGVLDVPDAARRIHKRATPLCGGIAVFFGALVGTALAGKLSDPFSLALFGGGAVFLLVGLLDDIYKLPADCKLLLEIPILLIPFAAGVLPTGASALFAGLFLLLSVNAVNFIDGMDGLCTLVCAGSFFALSPLLLQSGTASLFLLAALLGFLPHNRHPAKIFLGDTGALALGYAVGLSALVATDASPFLAPLFLFLPMLDLLLTIIRRVGNRTPLFAADGGHIHHKLLSRGTPYRTAVRDLSLLHLSVCSLTLLIFVTI